jgi:hypothetical protein
MYLFSDCLYITEINPYISVVPDFSVVLEKVCLVTFFIKTAVMPLAFFQMLLQPKIFAAVGYNNVDILNPK